MAEGGYDPTTENKTPREDHGIDHDDDDDAWGNIDWNAPIDPEDPDRTQPFEPGASSTPYHEGEEHEMTNLPQEQTGMVHGPGEAAWKTLTFIYPDAKATDLEAFYDPKTQRLRVKMAGAGKKTYFLYRISQQTGQERLNPDLTKEIKAALGESALEQSATLQQERDTNLREIVQKRDKLTQMQDAAQEVQERRQDLENLRDRIKRFDDDIRELEDKAGPLDEEAIQRLKDEKKTLEAEHQRKREQLDQADADAKTALQLQVDINDLKLANRDIEKQINKLGIKVRKPLEELQQEKADLEKRLDEKRLVLEDENASPSEREAAKMQVEQDERALERVNEDMEREEQKLPLRERVKNIFKKYGWTLQAVALAVGIVLSALALAATNGLKAGTKALGNGLKTIGQKLGSLLPGLIGSIVSYIFKAAGSVLSFLGEHAWLLILAVVAFFMERLLKRKSR